MIVETLESRIEVQARSNPASSASVSALPDRNSSLIRSKIRMLPSTAVPMPIKKPVIAVVYTEYLPYLTTESLHAVVIVGIDEQHVYFNDPLLEQAPIVLSVEEFQRAWYFWGNVIIILEPLINENR